MALYNPLSLRQPSRMNEMSLAMRVMDIIIAPGTQALALASSPSHKQRLDKHTGMYFGYRKTAHSNKSAVCSTFLEKGRFREQHVVEFISAPEKLTGKGGAVRLRSGRFDTATYFPLRPPKHSEFAGWKRTVDLLAAWVHNLIQHAKQGSLIVLGTDLHDGMGHQMVEGIASTTVSSALGDHPFAVDGYAAAKLRELLEIEHMMVADTVHKVDTTYYGSTSSTSNIDHTCWPRGALPILKKCYTCPSLARKLRIIPDNVSRDRVPVVVELDYILGFAPSAAAVRWDRDKSMAAVAHGDGKAGFIKEVEDIRKKRRSHWERHQRQPLPDEAWETFDGGGGRWPRSSLVSASRATCGMSRRRRRGGDS